MFQDMLAAGGGGGGINLQSGEYSNTVNSGQFDLQNITFDTPFATVPKVYVRATRNTRDYGDDANRYIFANPISVTTSGFTISYSEYETNNVTVKVEWVAFVD